MAPDRRTFMKTIGGAAAAYSTMSDSNVANAFQAGTSARNLRAFAFDAYGTLFDVYAVAELCEELFPGHGDQMTQIWRTKQLQYSLLRALMGRYRDFWGLTEDGLVYAAKTLQVDLTDEKRKRLMDAYLNLTAFPDVKPGLEALKKLGLRLAILSNGEPKMLAAAARTAGIDTVLDDVISVDEIKTFKPNPPVYQLALSHLNVGVGELGFVSSNSWDINGATSAGLTTFWIQRNAQEPPEELGFNTNRVVRSLTDLPGLVRP